MRPLLLLLPLLYLAGCGKGPSPQAVDADVPIAANDLPAGTSPGSQKNRTPLALNAYRETIDLTGYKDLGSFHFKRLHFYAKENPGMTIGPASVDQITLYFIDRYLVKMRYRLSEDVSEFLADSLGTQAGKATDLKSNWARYHQIRWSYFSKLITYQNRCPEEDLANELTNTDCEGGYWLYAELPGYRKKVKELEDVAKYVKEYLIDDPPNKASPD